MLVIGSRAIRYHFPEFRPPRDWDLIGSEAEIARLDRVLPRLTHEKLSPEKACYSYHGTFVEVGCTERLPYWDMVCKAFAREATIEDPVLGTLVIPPAGYLLLTKQCGLIYHVLHWHKNLEDLYFLRDRIPTLPDHVAALLPETLKDSKRMFAAGHQESESPDPCHPKAARGPADPALHRALHRRLKLGAIPAVEEPRAWEGFPSLPGEARRERMIDLFAEEAMVMGAERAIRPLAGEEGQSHPEGELQRWALRMVIVSSMPEGLRYFGVNYYREIAARIPAGWLAKGAVT